MFDMALLIVFLFILFFHWVGDFVFQTHWQAINKSTNNIALSMHVLSYTATIAVGMFLILCAFGGPWSMIINMTLAYAAINGILHWLTDWCTSRASSYMWKKNDVHNFFVVIGFDQLLHSFALAATLIGILIYMVGA